jgi:hypothetical protein
VESRTEALDKGPQRPTKISSIDTHPTPSWTTTIKSMHGISIGSRYGDIVCYPL